MRCDQCIYEDRTECHRFPPLKGFPIVRNDSWCGEFKPKEAEHAIEERKIEESSVGEYQGIDALRETTETSGSHSDGQGQEAEKTVKHRGWPKGKPRK